MASQPTPTVKPTKGKKSDRDPFEVDLSKEKEAELIGFLVREIDYAEIARADIVGDNTRLDQGHLMYEGGDGSLTKDTPWKGAANLGSFIVTEKVDSMRARIVATLFADPTWIVEGYGDSAERAPLVEQFHQWKAEQEKLQSFMVRVAHNALIEGTGVLEISDRIVRRKGRRKIKALLQVDHASGAVMLDQQGNEVPVLTQDGRYVEAGPDEPALEMIIDDIVRASNGPSFRTLSLKNFFIMPGHASEREDIWGYAKRVYRRLPELQQRERDGYYKNVDDLGKAGERDTPSGIATDYPKNLRENYQTPPQNDETAEKEIFEVTLLADLDDDGYEEWYVVTLSRLHRTLLRVQYQDYGTPHYCLFVPFPRSNSIYGFSYAMDKLGSLYDEHSALRNMFADRSNLASSAPFLQIEGSPWNPSLKPFGPRQVIPVRDLNEIKQLEVKDVPNSIMAAMQQVLSAAERLSGQNDTTTGHLAQQDRTLGEIKITTEQSFVRIDEVIKNFQEGMEDLFDLHHIIWRNKLEQEPEPVPGDVLLAMTERGIQIPFGTVNASMLEGVFRGKPHGSVESADYTKMRADFAQMLTAMTQLAHAVPAVGVHMNDPKVVRSIISQLARIYRWPDRQNLVGAWDGAMPPPPPDAKKGDDTEPSSSFSFKGEDLNNPIIMSVFSALMQKEGLMQAPAPPQMPQMPPGMGHPGAPLAGAPGNVTSPTFHPPGVHPGA